ncbi:MAG: carbohydrate porin [Fimbriimonas sp.]|nr:carbohydrate porin [Fimbriimonas sp.]
MTRTLFAAFLAAGAVATVLATDSLPPVRQASPPQNAVSRAKNYLIGGQITIVPQTLFPFRSPYTGPNSLIAPARQATVWTDTYTFFLGWRPSQGVEVYVDPELARGSGIGGATGLGGYTNGDVLRVPGFAIGALPETPYLARYFGRWTVSTGHGIADVQAGENQFGGKMPQDRLVVSAGKMSVTDIFDSNTYSNSTRTQFLNWGFINCAAYDYAADTRGYSDGISVEWVHPSWAIRLGSFEMPAVPNGPVLATRWDQDRGDQLEGDYSPQLVKGLDAATVRLLGYRNVAHMGSYREAIQEGKAKGTAPSITGAERDGADKYGFVLNVEQPLGDQGETGIFTRLGWNDGQTESFAYTECDDQVSLGAQFSGKRWRSPQDRIGVALLSDGLSAPHRDYLAAGGDGFLLGDGRLRYGREMILETYWQRQVTKEVSFALDYQLIGNPGYNQDRGPVSVITARVHYEF